MWRLLFGYSIADQLRPGWRGLTRVAVAGAALWPLGVQAGENVGQLPVPDIDPVAAIWLGSLLFFLTGFLAGVFMLHFLNKFSEKGRR